MTFWARHQNLPRILKPIFEKVIPGKPCTSHHDKITRFTSQLGAINGSKLSDGGIYTEKTFNY